MNVHVDVFRRHHDVQDIEREVVFHQPLSVCLLYVQEHEIVLYVSAVYEEGAVPHGPVSEGRKSYHSPHEYAVEGIVDVYELIL